MKVYKEVTNDKGAAQRCSASDNMATYILTSAYAHDLRNDYLARYNRVPSSRWYNRHFTFELIKG